MSAILVQQETIVLTRFIQGPPGPGGVPGDGLVVDGGTVNVGAGPGIVVDADSVGIAAGGVVNEMVATGTLTADRLAFAVATQEELDDAVLALFDAIAAAGAALPEQVQDVLAATLQAGAHVDLSYDDVAGTLTVAVAGLEPGDVAGFVEAAQDAAGAMVAGSATLDLDYDDAAGTVTGTVLDSPTVAGETPVELRDRSTHIGTQPAASIVDLAEVVQDLIGGMVAAGHAVDVAYDDVAATLTVAVDGLVAADIADFAEAAGAVAGATAPPDGSVTFAKLAFSFVEEAQDVVGAMLRDTATLDLVYDDVAGRFEGHVLDSPAVEGNSAAELRDRASHTGTQDASTIEDFDLAVRANRLEQMAAPLGELNMNGHRVVDAADPIDDDDLATRGYVDARPIAGAGITRTGDTLDVGEGPGIEVLADSVGIASGSVTGGVGGMLAPATVEALNIASETITDAEVAPDAAIAQSKVLGLTGDLVDLSDRIDEEAARAEDAEADLLALIAPTPYSFGAVGDGDLHPLSERFATIGDAQAVYPRAGDLSEEIDRHAWQALVDSFPQSDGAGPRSLSFRAAEGHYRFDDWVEFELYYQLQVIGEGGMTRVEPTPAMVALGDRAPFRVVNCYRPTFDHFCVEGHAGTVSAGFIIVEDHGSEPVGTEMASTGLNLVRMSIGSGSNDTLEDGVRWETTGLDENNDDANITDCNVFNFSGAAYRTTHLNSLRHKIRGGSISSTIPGAKAFRTGLPGEDDDSGGYLGGGSFDQSGVRISVPGKVCHYGKGTYTHPQSLVQIKAREMPTQLDTWTVTITGAPAGGTFKLAVNGQQTADLGPTTNAAAAQAAIEALSNVAPGDVFVTGGPLPGTLTVTFSGALAYAPQELATAAVALTGGTAPAVALTHTEGYGGEWFYASPEAIGLRCYVKASQFGSASRNRTVLDWQAPGSVFEAEGSSFEGEVGCRMDFGDGATVMTKFNGGALNAAHLAWNGYLILDGVTDYSGSLIATGLEPGPNAKVWYEKLYDGTGRFTSFGVQGSRFSRIPGGWEITTTDEVDPVTGPSQPPILSIRSAVAGRSPQLVFAGPSGLHYALYETTAPDGSPGPFHFFSYATGDIITCATDGAIGFNGAAPVIPILGGAATDPASTMALTNLLRSALIALGIATA